MHFAEKEWSRVDSQLAQRAVESHQTPEHRLRTRSAFGKLLKNPVVNQVEKLRHDGKNCDVSFVQGPQKFGCIQRLQIHYSRALDQRKHEVRHLRQNVEHRQHSQHRVFFSQIGPGEDSFHFRQKVGVRQHHALGIGRSS